MGVELTALHVNCIDMAVGTALTPIVYTRSRIMTMQELVLCRTVKNNYAHFEKKEYCPQRYSPVIGSTMPAKRTSACTILVLPPTMNTNLQALIIFHGFTASQARISGFGWPSHSGIG